jgi:hypothetical protein
MLKQKINVELGTLQLPGIRHFSPERVIIYASV